MKRAVLALAVLVIAGLPGMARAIGQSDSPLAGITVTPFLQNISIDPGKPATTFSLSISNDSDSSRDMSLSVLDFGTLNDSGGVAFSGSQVNSFAKRYGLAKWLSLSQSKLQLGPHQKKTVTATIKNSADLTPGGHYAAIMISAEATGISGANGIGLNQTLSSLVLAVKTGGDHYDLRLSSVNANGSIFKMPSQVRLKFYDPGNVHVVPRGVVKLIGPGNKTISQGAINQESSFILPDTYRTMFVDLHSVKSARSWLPIASYRLEVDYRYDGISQYAAKSITIKKLNWPADIVYVIVLILIFYSLVQSLNRRRRS